MRRQLLKCAEAALGAVRNLRLRTKLSAAVVILIALIAVFVFVFFPRQLKRQATDAMIDKGTSIATVTAYAVSPGLYFEDTAAVRVGYEGAVQNSDLVYLVVLDTLRRPFSQYNPHGFQVASDSASGAWFRLTPDENTLLVGVPISVKDQEIGRIEIGLSLRRLSADILAARSMTAVVSCFILFFGIVMAWSISTLVTRPLSRIVETVEVISKGDLSRRVDVHTRDEVGALAQSFDRMVDNLEIAHDSLQLVNRTLECRAEELTVEIAERKRAEAELKAFTVRLEQSNKDLQEFAYVASHDLQEPLRKIRAFGERLSTKLGVSLDEQAADYLQRMRNAAGRMQTLINDLLSYSRVTTKAQSPVKIDLHELTFEVLEDLEVRIQETGAKVEVGALPVIEGDPLQIRQLMQNVIGNALKYRRPGTPPVVKVSGVEDGAFWRIAVEDNGIGFEQQYADKIFGIFQRLHGREAYEGTGVGLAICRKIVERHGGSIGAEGFPGKGARFTIFLPALNLKEERYEEGVESNYASVGR